MGAQITHEIRKPLASATGVGRRLDAATCLLPASASIAPADADTAPQTLAGGASSSDAPVKKKRRRTASAPSLLGRTLPPLSWRDLASSEPLSAEEEALPSLMALARQFNPGMALPAQDIWPVEVRYAWHDGSDLKARVMGKDGRLVRDYIALDWERLANNEWAGLADRADQDNRIDYHVDAPGDDRAWQGVTGWRQRWRSIMGGNAAAHEPPQALDYRPTQYVHLFWFNRAKGLLGIQYWFYYPYNEWINHHEGDWEHINVIVRGPSRVSEKAVWRPVGYQFFFHCWTYEPGQVARIRGSDPREDHILVYAGGYSQFLLWKGWNSGGSYPLPALFAAAGGGLGKKDRRNQASSGLATTSRRSGSGEQDEVEVFRPDETCRLGRVLGGAPLPAGQAADRGLDRQEGEAPVPTRNPGRQRGLRRQPRLGGFARGARHYV
jgi:hypothetical protein